MKNKNEKAKEVLEKFNDETTSLHLLNTIKESLGNNAKIHWKLLLHPSIRMALFVGIGLSVFQQVTGINAILYYAPEIFKSFGSSANSSLLETSFLGVINLLFTIIAIFLVDKKGRKPLLYFGTAGMFVALSVVGYAAYLSHYQHLVIAIFIIVHGFIFYFMGACCLGFVVRNISE